MQWAKGGRFRKLLQKGWAAMCPLTSPIPPLWILRSTKRTGCRIWSGSCTLLESILCCCQWQNTALAESGLTHPDILYVLVCHLLQMLGQKQEALLRSVRYFCQMSISYSTLLTVVVFKILFLTLRTREGETAAEQVTHLVFMRLLSKLI